jgi:transcriptional regulator with XRE-family HTH domain
MPTLPATLDPLSTQLAQRLRELRRQAKLSLEQLAEASGVSRSMISSIERGETNPTAVVLDKLATALGLSLSELFDPMAASIPPRAAAAQDLLSRAAQPHWQDPASGYQRRSLSPTQPYPGYRSTLRLVEVQFPAGARVSYDTPGLAVPIHQEVWLIEGRMQITVGTHVHDMATGDCLAMLVNQPIVFFNPFDQAARYLVAQA